MSQNKNDQNENQDIFQELTNKSSFRNKDIVFCNLCEHNSAENRDLKFIKDENGNAGAGLCLCNVCISLFNEASLSMFQKSSKQDSPVIYQKPQPKEIFAYLNRFIISQDKAKRRLAIAISHHFRRLHDPSINKSNVLILGPTGTGKTEMARTIASYLDIPFAVADATSLTTRGYIGEDTESVVARLLASVDYNVKKAEQGIIFIDEIDKLAKSQNKDSQIATVSVQQELLKIMEGSIVKIKGKNKEDILFNTKNVLFICAGAFEGIQKVDAKKESKQIGFLQKEINVASIVSSPVYESEDLIKYGMIAELMGRIAIITQTEHLSEQDLLKILTEPENSMVKQYKKLAMQDNVELEFDESFLLKISKEAMAKKLGARGSRTFLEHHLEDVFFNIDEYSGKKILIGEKIEVVDQESTQIAKA